MIHTASSTPNTETAGHLDRLVRRTVFSEVSHVVSKMSTNREWAKNANEFSKVIRFASVATGAKYSDIKTFVSLTPKTLDIINKFTQLCQKHLYTFGSDETIEMKLYITSNGAPVTSMPIALLIPQMEAFNEFILKGSTLKLSSKECPRQWKGIVARYTDENGTLKEYPNASVENLCNIKQNMCDQCELADTILRSMDIGKGDSDSNTLMCLGEFVNSNLMFTYKADDVPWSTQIDRSFEEGLINSVTTDLASAAATDSSSTNAKSVSATMPTVAPRRGRNVEESPALLSRRPSEHEFHHSRSASGENLPHYERESSEPESFSTLQRFFPKNNSVIPHGRRSVSGGSDSSAMSAVQLKRRK